LFFFAEEALAIVVANVNKFLSTGILNFLVSVEESIFLLAF
jgi:hypothetical protein